MAQYEYVPRYGIENYSYVFPFEDTFDPVESTKWMQKNWHHSISLSIFYVLAIYAGQRFMESRKPFLLDGALFYWNLFLALFSTMGFLRMTPEFFWSINSNSFTYSICVASYAQGVTGFWTEQFAMSKVFEFVDTAFIVLRKRPLIFLHWYHHITVLVYCWHAYKDHTASGRWFIYMNYFVHSFMYSYYALRAAKIRVPKFCAMFVTIIQILQMLMGVYIGITIYGIKTAGSSCQQTWDNLYFSFMIYFSYFLLFANFFYQTYIRKGNRYAKPVKSTAEAPPKQNGVTPIAELQKQNGHKSNGHLANGSVATTTTEVPKQQNAGVERVSNGGGPVTRRRAQAQQID